MGYRFEKLIAWQKAMNFCLKIYAVTKSFPKEELYGITSQIRRATTSIALNIAEGSACPSKKEFIRFLYISLRSQYEVVTLIKLCHRLKLLEDRQNDELLDAAGEVGRLVQGLINSLKTKN